MKIRNSEKKTWSTPRLVEHGGIERLTGVITDPVKVKASGILQARPSPS